MRDLELKAPVEISGALCRLHYGATEVMLA